MLLRGWMLWREGDGPATWTRGVWRADPSGIHRLDDGAAPRAGEDVLEGWVVPGLVDVHAHIGIDAEGPVGREEQLRQLRAQAQAGVLALRDCGAPVDNSWVQEERGVPLLVRAGQHIARPKRYIRGLPIDVEDVSDLPDVVAEQAGRSDGWVKIVGDWIDRSRGAEADLDPLWPHEVLVDAVAAAHETGAKVAVHAFSHRVIDDLLEAGVDDIEHGSGMDADQLSEAAARGVSVTPTLLQVELFEDFARAAGEKYPVYAATMRAMHEARREHAQLIFDSGVRILPGSDSGGYQEHGSLLAELALWAERGMAPQRIVDVATWQARDVLGLETLAEGARADLVVLASDPRTDVAALAAPTAVLIAGERVPTGG